MSGRRPDVRFARKQINDLNLIWLCISSLFEKVKRNYKYLVISCVIKPFKYTCIRIFLSKVLCRHFRKRYKRSRKHDLYASSCYKENGKALSLLAWLAFTLCLFLCYHSLLPFSFCLRKKTTVSISSYNGWEVVIHVKSANKS